MITNRYVKTIFFKRTYSSILIDGIDIPPLFGKSVIVERRNIVTNACKQIITGVFIRNCWYHDGIGIPETIVANSGIEKTETHSIAISRVKRMLRIVIGTAKTK